MKSLVPAGPRHAGGSGPAGPTATDSAPFPAVTVLLAALLTVLLTGLLIVPPAGRSGASAADPPVFLGTAGIFAVLAGASVVNTGASIITGDLGVTPGTTVSGFPPGDVAGTIHVDDPVAVQAQTDFTTAYNDLASRTPTTAVPADLGATTLTPGVYTSVSGAFSNTGDLTLDAQGDPDAIFIFRAVSTLLTAGASTVTLTGGAQARNVFWQVGTSATLGAASTLSGTILALASITAGAGMVVDGRFLARDGTVTLDSDTITRPTGPLSISVPESVNLGTAKPGSEISAQLGAVTVTDTRYVPDAAWTATVSSTTFVTGGATASETIAKSLIGYSPGTATATTGDADLTPGTSGNLSSARTAFSAADGTGENSATWNPTLTVTLPVTVRVGTYTATITHSVA